MKHWIFNVKDVWLSLSKIRLQTNSKLQKPVQRRQNKKLHQLLVEKLQTMKRCVFVFVHI